MSQTSNSNQIRRRFVRPAGIASLGLLGMAVPGALAQCPPDLWKQTWSEEFNGTALNTGVWSYEVGRWPYNSELENYQVSAVTVHDGLLEIKATQDSHYNPPYVSGRIRTQGHFIQQYGRFEARIKLPKGQGIWPAFWLLPDNQWPPEIDILELLGHQPNTAYFTNHWGVYPNVASQGFNFVGPDFSADFHVFACEWFPDRIDYFVDGVKRATARNAGIPQTPMYVILNLAVGGQWPGNPNATTVFPQSMLVDYVRAYEMLGPAQQLLQNPGFENQGPAGNQPTYQWITTGNAYGQTAHVHTGARSGKLFGRFIGTLSTSSFYQEVPATAGDTYAGSGWFYNASDDYMRAANTCSLVIEWLNQSNSPISRSQVVALDASTISNIHTRTVVFGTAPANTVKARFMVEFRQPANDAGAAFFDDLVFGRVTCPVCVADFNQDGGIDGADVESFYSAWESGDTRADVNDDGGIDGGDVQVFFEAWGAGSC